MLHHGNQEIRSALHGERFRYLTQDSICDISSNISKIIFPNIVADRHTNSYCNNLRTTQYVSQGSIQRDMEISIWKHPLEISIGRIHSGGRTRTPKIDIYPIYYLILNLNPISLTSQSVSNLKHIMLNIILKHQEFKHLRKSRCSCDLNLT